MLEAVGLTREERDTIEGLSPGARIDAARSASSAAHAAWTKLAADPPGGFGRLQRLTAANLLRPYPLGQRFSGANMNPLPPWLAGAQYVALNMTNVDVPATLHHALFNGTAGFVLKPQQMRDDGEAWPTLRETLHRTTIDILSLCSLPKIHERRPLLTGRRAACHDHVPELSGTGAPPDGLEPCSPCIGVSLHPIGGFSAVSATLPLPPENVTTEYFTRTVSRNGLNAHFEEQAHCLAAEPHETLLRMSVVAEGQQVAFETCVLGRLRCGFRVFRLRSSLGTRIDLCYVFVRITVGHEVHEWQNATQLRLEKRRRSTPPTFSAPTRSRQLGEEAVTMSM